MKELFDYCHQHDILVIADEVQTGIGRTGKLLCCENFGVKPDLVSLAKGLAGGLPIGAVLFGDKVENVLGPGMHGTTFGANPMACAGAKIVLERMTPAFLERVNAKGAYLKEKIEAMPNVGSVTGMGMMLGIELEKSDSKTVVASCIANGLIVLTAKSKVRLLPPLTITYEEIDQGLAVLEKVLSAL